MKNNNEFNASLLLLSSILMVTIISGLSSCSSPKAYNRLEIERLFMQTTKPEINFSGQGGLQDTKTPKTISEYVTYNNTSEKLEQNEELLDGNNKIDTSKVYKLPEVEIKVKSNFASERDGKVHVDFDLIARTDILDPNWRLSLSPKLIDGDSICQLDSVIITGEGFKDKQVGDYEAYNDFLSAIVDSSAYDSLYIDWKGLNKEILKIQRRNYNDYRNNYDLLMRYENWKKMNEMEFLSMEALALRHKKHMYERYWRKAEKKIAKNEQNGKNSVGIHREYEEKYKKDYIRFLKDKFSLSWLDSITINTNLHAQKDSILRRSYIPRRYRKIHEMGTTLKDIQAKAFTKQDSINIAKHHYLIDEIVLNEMNKNRKDDVFKEIVEFPYREEGLSYKIRVDTVITAENDFIYRYKQSWKVKPGMKNLKVILDGRVEAIDRSVFEFPTSDTLTYFIASLSQLADESLITERKRLYKSMFDKISIYPSYRTRKTYKFDNNNNAGIFDKLIEAYNTYSANPNYAIDSITVRSMTDLQGDWGDNYDLSFQRANSISDYLKNKIGAPLAVEPKGEDWNALVKEIQIRSDMPNSSAILDILTKATYPDQTEEDIKKLYPDDYKVMRDKIYPGLQRIDFIINIRRTDIEHDTIKETFREDYAEAIKLLKNREYMPALEILANYPDFNTALCLVCMGYNDKAEKVLADLPESAKNEYLLAIISSRKEDPKKASEHLIKACKLNPNLYNRVSLDAELNDLANKLNLWPRLSSL